MEMSDSQRNPGNLDFRNVNLIMVIFICSPAVKSATPFCREVAIKKSQFYKINLDIYFILDQTKLLREPLSSLHGGSLEITLTVPLIIYI